MISALRGTLWLAVRPVPFEPTNQGAAVVFRGRQAHFTRERLAHEVRWRNSYERMLTASILYAVHSYNNEQSHRHSEDATVFIFNIVH